MKFGGLKHQHKIMISGEKILLSYDIRVLSDSLENRVLVRSRPPNTPYTLWDALKRSPTI